MAVFNKFQPFSAALANGVHNLATNQLTVALTSVAPTSAMGVLADLTQIAYTGMSTRNITTTSSAQTAGLYRLILADLTLTQTTGTSASFRYVVVFNSTPAAGNLLGFYDYGVGGLILNTGESILIDLDQVNGLIQLT